MVRNSPATRGGGPRVGSGRPDPRPGRGQGGRRAGDDAHGLDRGHAALGMISPTGPNTGCLHECQANKCDDDFGINRSRQAVPGAGLPREPLADHRMTGAENIHAQAD